MTTDAQELSEALHQFTGTETYHRNPFYPWVVYTDGVKYFAENAGGGAYWFLDIIGTELRPLALVEPIMMVTLNAKDGAAVISATDGGDKVLYSRVIDFTDCPEGVWMFYLTDDVLLLPSEY